MCTAGVGIIAVLKLQNSQFTDPYSFRAGQFENEYVDAFGQNIRWAMDPGV